MSAGPSPSVPLGEREMPMKNEMSKKSYQAVRCIYSSEPIPLSTRHSEELIYGRFATGYSLLGVGATNHDEIKRSFSLLTVP
jgi:hypothetical protein